MVRKREKGKLTYQLQQGKVHIIWNNKKKRRSRVLIKEKKERAASKKGPPEKERVVCVLFVKGGGSRHSDLLRKEKKGRGPRAQALQVVRKKPRENRPYCGEEGKEKRFRSHRRGAPLSAWEEKAGFHRTAREGIIID